MSEAKPRKQHVVLPALGRTEMLPDLSAGFVNGKLVKVKNYVSYYQPVNKRERGQDNERS